MVNSLALVQYLCPCLHLIALWPSFPQFLHKFLTGRAHLHSLKIFLTFFLRLTNLRKVRIKPPPSLASKFVFHDYIWQHFQMIEVLEQNESSTVGQVERHTSRQNFPRLPSSLYVHLGMPFASKI